MSLVMRALGYFLNTLAIVVNYLTDLIFPRRPHKFPTIKNPLLNKPIVELLNEIRERKLTSQEIVKAYIQRIREVNQSLNAVVDDRFELALKEAQHADQLIAKARNEAELLALYQRYPLLGMPCTVKESCGVEGLSFSVGSILRKNEKCTESGEVVQLLKSAGCIPLLVSANPEFCLNFETDTHVNGRCLNPYDMRRSSAGSSGGEGALNGAGASLFGLGSDISGSIRLPALFCGVFGHKPTGGLTSVRGHNPMSISDPEFPYFLQLGPITRFAKDLPLLMQVMAGKNADKLKFDEGVDLKNLKIFYTYSMGTFLHVPTDYEIKLAITRAVKCFEKGGFQTEQANVPAFQNAIELCISGMLSIKNIPSIMTLSATKRASRKKLIAEMGRCLMGKSSFTFLPLILEFIIDVNSFFTQAESDYWRSELKHIKADLIEMLGSNGVLILPTYHKNANLFYGASILNISGTILMLLFNILGFPATHIPMGLDRHGLPIGIQVVAAPYMDKLCLQVAAEMEGAFGGWQQPKAR